MPMYEERLQKRERKMIWFTSWGELEDHLYQYPGLDELDESDGMVLDQDEEEE